MIDWKWIVSRLATGLHKLPSEVVKMTLPQVYDLFDYWGEYPPIHEASSIFLRCFTTWKPIVANPDPPEVAHRKSLEARWASGYMNVKQMFEAGGGSVFKFARQEGQGKLPGIGPLPGASPPALAAAP